MRSRPSVLAPAGERRLPRPERPTGPGGVSAWSLHQSRDTPVQGPLPSKFEAKNLSSRRFRSRALGAASPALRPPALPQGRRPGYPGFPDPSVQRARGAHLLPPEPPARRCEQSLRVGCSAVCRVMAQTGIITSSYKRGRGGPEMRAQGHEENPEPAFWPQSLSILTPLPYFCYPHRS